MIPFNHLSNLDVSKLEDLEILHVSHNKITKLENLPKKLKELVCDNNKLERLNLEGLTELKVLTISNNIITLIEDLPVGVIDFKMENTPAIEFRNSVLPELRASNKDEDELLKNHKNYIESLHEYFRLKNEYQIKRSKMMKAAFKKEPSRRLGKLAALSIKPPCINCKRPVGTIFTNRDNDKYIALCGDKSNPCNLNIKIFNGKIINLYYILNVYQEEIADIKDTIIRQKLDTLFSYTSEEKSVTLFKKELDTYNANSKIYKQLLEKYVDLYDNEHKKKMVEDKLNQIFILKDKLSSLLKEYEISQNPLVLTSAMNLQINELYPEVRNLRLLKNEISELYEPEENKFKIFNYPVLLENIDHDFGEKATVLKFQKE